jgi:hypothetical protein
LSSYSLLPLALQGHSSSHIFPHSLNQSYWYSIFSPSLPSLDIGPAKDHCSLTLCLLTFSLLLDAHLIAIIPSIHSALENQHILYIIPINLSWFWGQSGAHCRTVIKALYTMHDVAGLRPSEVNYFYNLPYSSALGFTQPVTEMSARDRNKNFCRE